jgi:hypothetical protein
MPSSSWGRDHAPRGKGVWEQSQDRALAPGKWSALPTAGTAFRGGLARTEGGAGVVDTLRFARKNAADAYEWATVSLGGGGVTLLAAPTTFTGVASVSLPTDTFTATYRNYRVVIEITEVSTTLSVTARLRVAGVDASGATDYDFGNVSAQSDSATVVVDSNSDSSFLIGVDLNATTDRGAMELTLWAPKIATPTLLTGSWLVYNESADTVGGTISGGHGLATAYDSLTVLASTGTFGGSIRVYGYQDAL